MDIKNDDLIKPKSTDVLQLIIDVKGDCINASWCLVCPFVDKCISNAIVGGRMIPKHRRVELAYDLLFNKMIEEELDENNV